ncbi:MAG: VWA domain-containing protein [Bdellovibrionales bacterium]|nr:VWA domain-containing protein [Bdellovibrionales bacterium]
MFPIPDFSSLSFFYPWVFFLSPFPLLFLLKRKRPDSYPLHPNILLLEKIPKSPRSYLRTPILSFVFTLFYLSLVVAAARPQWRSPLPQEIRGKNIMLAIDLSRSMGAADFQSGIVTLSRLEGTKKVLTQFIESRPADRFGLSLFGSSAYLQSPLTNDHALIIQFIQRLNVGLAGDGTAIGDGLGLALKRIEDLPAQSKAVILMTDGVSNSGKVDPLQAAQVARDLGIKVHTIGIGGEPSQSFMNSFFPVRRNVEFDEETLKKIASLTGGVYFHANNLPRLQEVYDEINRLEDTTSEERRKDHVEELFDSFATSALLSFLLLTILSTTVLSKIP